MTSTSNLLEELREPFAEMHFSTPMEAANEIEKLRQFVADFYEWKRWTKDTPGPYRNTLDTLEQRAKEILEDQ